MEIKEFLKPKSLDEAFEVLSASSNNRIIGGGAWIKISLKKVDTLISLEELDLNYIKEENDFYEIGSMTSLRDLEVHDGIKSLASGILSQAISNIMGVTVRNIATIGGSVMGKFAFSDLLGVLQVLDAELVFYQMGIVSVEDFVNMTKIPKDILLAIKIKKQTGKAYFKKIAITHLDFSILNMAITNSKGLKIAVGSRPNIAIRARRTEVFLNGKKAITDDLINEAIDLAMDEIKLGDNSRGSKDYRELLMKTYLKRAIREVI
ncbi:MAG: FAD binding domain-containing protein [Candidatus Izemoplasmatales bacterium]|jgi:CO/xanthine dehydrogenase FAD-binding subunit|nr:FAD binding domain-containing protein [Candidatus Izemoplasmatales bacterium]